MALISQSEAFAFYNYPQNAATRFQCEGSYGSASKPNPGGTVSGHIDVQGDSAKLNLMLVPKWSTDQDTLRQIHMSMTLDHSSNWFFLIFSENDLDQARQSKAVVGTFIFPLGLPGNNSVGKPARFELRDYSMLGQTEDIYAILLQYSLVQHFEVHCQIQNSSGIRD